MTRNLLKFMRRRVIEELQDVNSDNAAYLKCLKVWKANDNPKKALWLSEMSGKAKIFIAKDDEQNVVGMIQIIPIEDSNCHGQNMAFIQCLRVNFYDEAFGNKQKNGYGKALLSSAIAYAKERGKDALVAWGTEYNGLLISRANGCFVRLGIVTTDLPLEEDSKTELGIERFCRLCALCVKTCPARTISESSGSELWKIEQEKCYKTWRSLGTDCGICISACPIGQEISAQTISGMSDEQIGAFIDDYRAKHGSRKLTAGKIFG